MKGYKVFNSDWKCRDFQFKVGETFKHEGEIAVCQEGFHFCQKIADCFNYYIFDSNNKVAEIEATGKVLTEGDKSVTDEIRILKEISWHEVLDMVNTGKNCTGFGNSGWYNSGRYNSGSYNSGWYNSGWNNSGNYNSGSYNSGSYNSGNYNSGWNNSGWNNSGWNNSGWNNSGSYNSGNYNSGWYNSGSYNSCNCSAGFFNSVTQPVYAFNKPLSIGRNEFIDCEGVQIMSRLKLCEWVDSDMTDEEKKTFPECQTTGGYLKKLDFKEACQQLWNSLDDDEKQAVREIPNFDADVFEEITGIHTVERNTDNAQT